MRSWLCGSAQGWLSAPRDATRWAHLPSRWRAACSASLGCATGATLVAVAVLTHDGRKGWINRLAVDPAYRRQGLARRLVVAAERWFAQDLGLEVWAALVAHHNTASLALFDALGYGRPDVVYVSQRTRSDA